MCVYLLSQVFTDSKKAYAAYKHIVRFVRVPPGRRARLAGLVDVAQQLGDFDEASHCALRLLLQPLVVLPEALHLSLQHRLVLFLLTDSDTRQEQRPSLTSINIHTELPVKRHKHCGGVNDRSLSDIKLL